MFLQEPNIDRNYVPGKIRNAWIMRQLINIHLILPLSSQERRPLLGPLPNHIATFCVCYLNYYFSDEIGRYILFMWKCKDEVITLFVNNLIIFATSYRTSTQKRSTSPMWYYQTKKMYTYMLKQNTHKWMDGIVRAISNFIRYRTVSGHEHYCVN